VRGDVARRGVEASLLGRSHGATVLTYLLDRYEGATVLHSSACFNSLLLDHLLRHLDQDQSTNHFIPWSVWIKKTPGEAENARDTRRALSKRKVTDARSSTNDYSCSVCSKQKYKTVKTRMCHKIKILKFKMFKKIVCSDTSNTF